MKTAQTGHYYSFVKKGKKVHILIVSNTTRPVGTELVVSGKVEARQICKANNIQVWNF